MHMKKLKKIIILSIVWICDTYFNRTIEISAKDNINVTKKDIEEKESSFIGDRSKGQEYIYLGDKSKSTDGYTYIKGKIPVIISAPHSLRQPLRNSSKNSNGYKPADKYTGAIAKIIAEKTGAHVIYKSAYTGIDDNYMSEEESGTIRTPYRDKIEEIIKENDIKLLIDIHAFNNSSKSHAIELGTNDKKNLLGNENILNVILDSFEDHGFSTNGTTKNTKLLIDNEFKAEIKNKTISNYTATTLKTPAIQIEIGSTCRNIDDMDAFNRMLNALIDVTENASQMNYENHSQNWLFRTMNNLVLWFKNLWNK